MENIDNESRVNYAHLKPVKREFEMSEEQKKVYLERLVKTFRFLIDFLEQHNINYYAAYGTVLGAVRHHGFIPWDDDIDIYLTRENYNKLLSLRNELKGTDYELLTEEDEGYYLIFAKFADKTMTMWESEVFPLTFGAYIDIFILDSIDETNSEQKQICLKCQQEYIRFQKSLRRIPLGKAFRLFLKGKPKEIVKWALDKFFFRPLKKHYLRKYLALKSQILEFKGDSYVQFCSPNLERYIHKKEWYKDGRKVSFEGFEIVIPQDYDKYLTRQYGKDYMTPPPKEEQQSHHQLHYLNFDKYMTVSEVKEELKRKH